ncbi:MAG TPA: c-type cytochrome [Gemmatimonadaceae bacterium]
MTESAPPATPLEDRPRTDWKRRILKWTAITLGSLLGVVLLVAGVLYLRGKSTVGKTYDVAAQITNVPTDSASIAHGEHIAVTRGCTECHGERLEGKVLADVPPMVIAPPNLTRGAGGVGSQYSAVDWDKAVRYGVRPDGRALLPMMPYEFYNRLNDADMAALAAWLSSRPAVDNQVQPTRLKPLGYIMFGMGGLPREGLDRPRQIITPGATPEYGAYIASTTCVACHGPQLAGQKERGQLVPGLHAYGEIEVGALTRALRTGRAVDGRQLSDDMPWRAFRHFTDTEIAAIHAHLQGLARRD